MGPKNGFKLINIIIARTHTHDTFLRSLSNASFKLNMRRRSRILAARRCATDATRRRVFFVDADPFGAVIAPRGDKR